MYHSITFGSKNTWDDWHLVPTSRPVFNPPSVKTNIIDIPGANGSIDLTEALTGEPLFSDRTGSFEFIVVNDYTSWEKAYSDIMNYLHGKQMHAILEDDPNFYYNGRFSVNQWKSDRSWSLITINYTVDPFKKRRTSSLDPWFWDTFNFRTGIIATYDHIRVEGSLKIRIDYRDGQSVVPTFISSAPMTLVFDGESYEIPKGEYRRQKIKISKGIREFTFIGNGYVSIRYRGASL